jgi:subtilisin family serine protease
MPRTARRLPIVTLVLLLLACAAPRVNAAMSAPEKIAPWVFEHATAASPAEFMVVLEEQADLTPAAGIADRAVRARFVRDALFEKARATQAPLLAWLDERHVTYRSFYIVNAVLVTGTLDIAEALSARADVARIDGNPVLSQVRPVEPTPEELGAAALHAYSVQAIEPGVSAIRAPEVWATGATGQGIVVGSADTGVRWSHNALKGKYRGWDGVSAHHDYNWHDAVHAGGGTCGPNAVAPCDDYGHGTHTTGTAVGGDSSGANQVGVAPGARFIACRNMDQGDGTPARYLECMEWFLAPYPVGGTPAQGDPAMAPDVTINSWGCPASEGCAPATLLAGIEAQRAAGIMFVVAAGNSGSLGCSTVSDPPSFYDASFTVGADSAATGTIAPFSSRGPVTADGSGRTKPDICAPGVSVRSASSSGTGSYANSSGTSMATPHVAGAVALLWSARPSLRNRIDETENVLEQSAVSVSSAQCGAGGIPNNVYGWGRLDIKAAVDAGALSEAPGPAAAPAAGGVFMAPAYPNPAHGSTLLRFRLARAGALDLAVFSSGGQRVRTLAHGVFAAGERTLRWDGTDERGRAVAPAMYHVRLSSRGERASQKVIWLGR